MKVGCICGWIGKPEHLAVLGEAKVCPRCFRTRSEARQTYPIINCHWCGHSNNVQVIGERMYRCSKCNRQFDDDPNEGAAGCYTDPVLSAEQREARENSYRRERRGPRH